MSEENKKPALNDDGHVVAGKRYKFMTNILQGPLHQTRYLKSLEKVTMDAQVSYHRLFMSMGIGGVAVLLYLFRILGAGAKTKYLIGGGSLMLLAVMIFMVNYLISSRTKSMLTTASLLGYHPIKERLRLKSKNVGALKSIGIDKFEDGIIKFTNGDYGAIYAVEGQLSLSTLPGVADQIGNMRSNYIMSRSGSSQEQFIISITQTDTTDQQKLMSDYYKLETDDPNRDLWAKSMAIKIQDYIESNVNSEFTIVEHIIIRDIELGQLTKSMNIFEQNARSGMYAKINQLMTAEQVVKALAGIAMLSKKGQKVYGQEN